MRKQSIILVDKFSPFASDLRAHFDHNFSDPLSLAGSRFVWDYWHVPDQYSLLRTPAYHYFPKQLYSRFHKSLVLWGRRNLGCWDISPPWLSCYIDGCEQQLHSDHPHGPWAFVFSLSPTPRSFRGGETLILNDKVLEFWKNFTPGSNYEQRDISEKIDPRFNRLIVFDGRLPHAVTRVSGSRDPREGRLVVHGWFSRPKTYIEGYLPPKTTERVLNQAFAELQAQIAVRAELLDGMLALRLKVAKSGQVTAIEFPTFNVRTDEGKSPVFLKKNLSKLYSDLQFSSARGPTTVVIPLIFSR